MPPRNNANPGVASAPVGSNPFAPAPPGGQPGQPGGPSRGVPDEGATGPMLGKGSELEKVTWLSSPQKKTPKVFVAKNDAKLVVFFLWLLLFFLNKLVAVCGQTKPLIYRSFLGWGICEGVFFEGSR